MYHKYTCAPLSKSPSGAPVRLDTYISFDGGNNKETQFTLIQDYQSIFFEKLILIKLIANYEFLVDFNLASLCLSRLSPSWLD